MSEETNTNNQPTNEQPNPQQGTPQEGNNTAPAPEAGGNDDTPRTGEECMAQELKRAREEAAKYRVRARELAEQVEKAKTLEEKLQALEAEKQELAKAAAVAQQLERRLALVNALGDPKVAEFVEPHADKFIGEDGGVNVEAIYETFPFLKQAQSSPVRGANPGHTRGEPTLEELDRMSPEEINAWFARRKGM